MFVPTKVVGDVEAPGDGRDIYVLLCEEWQGWGGCLAACSAKDQLQWEGFRPQTNTRLHHRLDVGLPYDS